MYMNRIIPGLYISSIMAQHDQANVYAKGIRAVLRLDQFKGQRWSDDFNILHLPLESNTSLNGDDISACTEFIAKNLQAGDPVPVLIQSQRGIARAASIALAYLIEYEDMALPQAFVRLMMRYPDAHPYTDQIVSLVKHYDLGYAEDVVRSPGFFHRLVGEAQMSLNHIHDGVFIGSVLALNQVPRVQALGIESVLRLDRISRANGQWGDEFHLMDLPLPDGVPMGSAMIDSGVTFLREQTNMGRKVLVHCQMGVSRASSFVIAHLMENVGMSLPQAFQLVQAGRPIILPNPQLVQSLVRHYDLPYDVNAACKPTFLEDLLIAESRAV